MTTRETSSFIERYTLWLNTEPGAEANEYEYEGWLYREPMPRETDIDLDGYLLRRTRIDGKPYYIVESTNSLNKGQVFINAADFYFDSILLELNRPRDATMSGWLVINTENYRGVEVVRERIKDTRGTIYYLTDQTQNQLYPESAHAFPPN